MACSPCRLLSIKIFQSTPLCAAKSANNDCDPREYRYRPATLDKDRYSIYTVALAPPKQKSNSTTDQNCIDPILFLLHPEENLLFITESFENVNVPHTH